MILLIFKFSKIIRKSNRFFYHVGSKASISLSRNNLLSSGSPLSLPYHIPVFFCLYIQSDPSHESYTLKTQLFRIAFFLLLALPCCLFFFFFALNSFGELSMTKATGGESVTLDLLKEKTAEFAKERNWDQFHSPRNLLLALVCSCSVVISLFLVLQLFFFMVSCFSGSGHLVLMIYMNLLALCDPTKRHDHAYN